LKGENMQDPREKQAEQGIKERQSEATSKETLTDLEEHEKVSGSKADQSGEPNNVPSPDGQVDGHRDRGDDRDIGGPM